MKDEHPELKHSFDEVYDQSQMMFGHPYQELQDYFQVHPAKGKVLDLGSGQGRDALFLASLGYEVTAVDRSKVGVEQMMALAQEQNLKLNGVVGDVFELQLDGVFDVILFDMILHVFEQGQQVDLLKKYADSLNEKGIFCIVFPDDLTSVHFQNALNFTADEWDLLDEILINDVPKIEGEDIDFKFQMAVFQKL